MNPTDAIRQLEQLLAELELLPNNYRAAEVQEWRAKLDAVIELAFGLDSRIAEDLKHVRFSPTTNLPDPDEQIAIDFDAFHNAKNQFTGKVRGAIVQLSLSSSTTVSDEDFDDALWGHVGYLIEQAKWTDCASQTMIFLENTLRSVGGFSHEVYGADLMTKCFHPKSGKFPLGETDGEMEGWHLFARGLSMGIGNAVRHRLPIRPDSRQFALGVLGSASLLLTELRSVHGVT